MKKFIANYSLGHMHDSQAIQKVKSMYEYSSYKLAGLSVADFSYAVARMECVGQLKELINYRDSLESCSVAICGTRYYERSLVAWVFAADDYNYLPQLMRSGLISEPQGGLVEIDWMAIARYILG